MRRRKSPVATRPIINPKTRPNSWNTTSIPAHAQCARRLEYAGRPSLFYYEGSVWYRTRNLIRPELSPGHRLFVLFRRGQLQGGCLSERPKSSAGSIGGYTPFAYEITKLAQGERAIRSSCAWNNNRQRGRRPHTVNTRLVELNGGLTRDVMLSRCTSDVHLQLPRALEPWHDPNTG